MGSFKGSTRRATLVPDVGILVSLPGTAPEGNELGLNPALRGVLHRQQGASCTADAPSIQWGGLKTIETSGHPPIAGPALGLWYQGKALKVRAGCSASHPEIESARHSRQSAQSIR